MKKFIKNYINHDLKFNKKEKIAIAFLVISIAGLIGFIYEVLFYYLDSGFKTFYWRCDNFLPWINIYAIGSVLIFYFTYKKRKDPLSVFVIGALVCGVLEFFSGWLLYEKLGMVRAWDYNQEILNFGNIGGYVCFRSILFFGLSSLLLIYLVIPFCMWLSKKINKKLFFKFTIILGSIFIIDEVYNHVFAPVLGLPKAVDIYKAKGIKYKEFYREK